MLLTCIPFRTRRSTTSSPSKVGPSASTSERAVRDVVYAAYTATGAFTSDDTLFELRLERVLHAKYGPRPSWPPIYTKWSAG
jgi:hypothetical protein